MKSKLSTEVLNFIENIKLNLKNPERIKIIYHLDQPKEIRLIIKNDLKQLEVQIFEKYFLEYEWVFNDNIIFFNFDTSRLEEEEEKIQKISKYIFDYGINQLNLQNKHKINSLNNYFKVIDFTNLTEPIKTICFTPTEVQDPVAVYSRMNPLENFLQENIFSEFENQNQSNRIIYFSENLQKRLESIPSMRLFDETIYNIKYKINNNIPNDTIYVVQYDFSKENFYQYFTIII